MNVDPVVLDPFRTHMSHVPVRLTVSSGLLRSLPPSPSSPGISPWLEDRRFISRLSTSWFGARSFLSPHSTHMHHDFWLICEFGVLDFQFLKWGQRDRVIFKGNFWRIWPEFLNYAILASCAILVAGLARIVDTYDIFSWFNVIRALLNDLNRVTSNMSKNSRMLICYIFLCNLLSFDYLGA